MGHLQPGLPFNTLFGDVKEEAVVTPANTTREPRPPPITRIASPRFAAYGGRLEAAWPKRRRRVPSLRYPKPSEVAVDLYLPDRDDDTPDEETVAGWVEHTAQTLYELIRESADLERVARRFERPGARQDRLDTSITLRAEQAVVHADYHEALDAYRCLMGDEAADALAEWVEQLCTRRSRPSAHPTPEGPSP